MRGITIAGMILVNNSGGPGTYAPLQHAQWNGLTPTDLVFPFFMFIMGISTYISLRKFEFKPSWPLIGKNRETHGTDFPDRHVPGVAVDVRERDCCGGPHPH